MKRILLLSLLFLSCSASAILPVFIPIVSVLESLPVVVNVVRAGAFGADVVAMGVRGAAGVASNDAISAAAAPVISLITEGTLASNSALFGLSAVESAVVASAVGFTGVTISEFSIVAGMLVAVGGGVSVWQSIPYKEDGIDKVDYVNPLTLSRASAIPNDNVIRIATKPLDAKTSEYRKYQEMAVNNKVTDLTNHFAGQYGMEGKLTTTYSACHNYLSYCAEGGCGNDYGDPKACVFPTIQDAVKFDNNFYSTHVLGSYGQSATTLGSTYPADMTTSVISVVSSLIISAYGDFYMESRTTNIILGYNMESYKCGPGLTPSAIYQGGSFLCLPDYSLDPEYLQAEYIRDDIPQIEVWADNTVHFHPSFLKSRNEKKAYGAVMNGEIKDGRFLLSWKDDSAIEHVYQYSRDEKHAINRHQLNKVNKQAYKNGLLDANVQSSSTVPSPDDLVNLQFSTAFTDNKLLDAELSYSATKPIYTTSTTNPTTNPATNPVPGTDPATNPTTNPTTNPVPGTNPATNPTTDPTGAVNPSIDFGSAPNVTIDTSIPKDWYKNLLPLPFLDTYRNYKPSLQSAACPVYDIPTGKILTEYLSFTGFTDDTVFVLDMPCKLISPYYQSLRSLFMLSYFLMAIFIILSA